MANPQPSDLYVNQPLTEFAVMYMQNEKNFANTQMFPMVKVKKQGGKYVKYPKGAWFRSDAQLRAPGTESAGGEGYTVDTDSTYYCDLWARHHDVSDEARANFENPVLDPEKAAARFIAAKLALLREQTFIDNFVKTGVWGTDLQGGTSGGGKDFVQWSDYNNSDPITDIDTYRSAMLKATGKEPNRLMIGDDVFRALKNHPDILARMSVSQKRVLTVELLQQIFEIEKIIVAKGVYNTAAQGAADSMAFFVSKTALMCYTNTNDMPSKEDPSAGYRFAWTGYLGANNAEGIRVKKFRMENLASDRIEGECALDMKVTASDLGTYMYDCIA